MFNIVRQGQGKPGAQTQKEQARQDTKTKDSDEDQKPTRCKGLANQQLILHTKPGMTFSP